MDNEIKIKVNTEELDIAIEKANQLIKLLQEVDKFTGSQSD
ncbi:MAG: hypothetical protein ACK5MV_00410 [Aminipila sp.]